MPTNLLELVDLKGKKSKKTEKKTKTVKKAAKVDKSKKKEEPPKKGKQVVESDPETESSSSESEEETPKTKTTKTKKTSTSTAKAAAAALIAKGGPKTSTPFVDDLAKAFKNYSTDELYTMFFAVKRYSMDKAKFRDRLKESLKKSEDNMKEKGIAADKIKNSKPRQNYKDEGKKVKDILDKYFWDNVDERSLSWGNFMRIKEVEDFAIEVRKLSHVYKPKNQRVLYSNGYWMVAPFNEAVEEVKCRLGVIAVFINKLKGKYEVDGTGKVTDVSADFGDTDRIVTKYESQSIPATMEFMEKIGNWKLKELLHYAIVPNSKKLTQSKDYRISRGADPALHKQQEKVICDLMATTIYFAIRCLKIDVSADDTYKALVQTLKPESKFSTQYYTAYNVLHTFIRTCKREVFGGTLGANTRQADQDEFDVIDWEEFEEGEEGEEAGDEKDEGKEEEESEEEDEEEESDNEEPVQEKSKKLTKSGLIETK